jgi:hypothetical protein
LNWYTAFRNDPVNYIDPTGLSEVRVQGVSGTRNGQSFTTYIILAPEKNPVTVSLSYNSKQSWTSSSSYRPPSTSTGTSTSMLNASHDPIPLGNPVTNFVSNIFSEYPNGVHFLGQELTAAAGVRINSGRGLIFDTNWNFGLMDFIGIGGSTGIGISKGGFYGYVNAPSIHDVKRLSMEVGGSVAPPPLGFTPFFGPYFGLEHTLTLGNNQYHGAIGSIGFGLGAPSFEGHVQLTYTEITSSPLKIALRVILSRVAPGFRM